MSEKIGDVSWLFTQMTVAFGGRWLEIHNPKKKRHFKKDILEWGHQFHEFSRDELKFAISVAKNISELPPSMQDFLSLLLEKRAKNKAAIQREAARAPPSRTLGNSALQNIHAALGKQ